MSNSSDYVLSNQPGAGFRNELNTILGDIKSLNSGPAQSGLTPANQGPANKSAWMLWADTTNNLLKVRNAANNAWITLGGLSTGMGMASLSASNVQNFTGTIQTAGEIISNANTKLKMPVGTTVQRPLTPTVGDTRVNSDSTLLEVFTNNTKDNPLGSWLPLFSGAKIDVFHCTSPGTTSTGTFTPEDGRTFFLVICTGGGGGAGGVTVHGTTPSGGAPNFGGNYWGSSGGGGAGTAIRAYTLAELGASAGYTIGGRGAGSSSFGVNGGYGTTSVFTPIGTGVAIEGRFGGPSTPGYSTTSASDHTSRPGWHGDGHNGMINCHGEKGEFQTTNNYTGTTASGFGLVSMNSSGGSTFWGKGPGAGANGCWTNDSTTGGANGTHGQDGVIVVLSW